MNHLWRQFVVMLATVGLMVVLTAGTSGAAPTGPPLRTFPAALLYSLNHPDASPAGANDFSCRPSPAHPRPVVLVHGTAENAFSNWAELSPRLRAAGYCVFALNYGAPRGGAFRGVADVASGAAELGAYVDEVLAATGAREVDVVGHSQGGMLPRYYLRNLGGASKVGSLVALAPSNYGTVFYGVLPLVNALPGGNGALGLTCPACVQQRAGSGFLRELNSGGDTVPGVDYTVIATRFDQVIQPYWNSFLRDPGVDNIVLQRVCPLDLTDHLGISYDANAGRLVLNALDPDNAQRVECRPAPGTAS